MFKNNLFKLVGVVVILLVLVAGVSPMLVHAGGPTHEWECVNNAGGEWRGVGGGLPTDPNVGECYFAPGNGVFGCAAGEGYIIDYQTGFYNGDDCISPYPPLEYFLNALGHVYYGPLGRFGNLVQNEPAAGNLSLRGTRNGEINFFAGTCLGKCTITNSIPAGANASKPASTVTTLYVRVRNADQTPGAGGYHVCFDTTGVSSPSIYQYIGGSWVELPASLFGNTICGTAFGDGVFALVGE